MSKNGCLWRWPHLWGSLLLWGRFKGQSRLPGKGGELAGVGSDVVWLQLFQSEQKVERTSTTQLIQMQEILWKTEISKKPVKASFPNFRQPLLTNYDDLIVPALHISPNQWPTSAWHIQSCLCSWRMLMYNMNIVCLERFQVQIIHLNSQQSIW